MPALTKLIPPINTGPLVKAVRTSEGVLVGLTTVGLVLTTSIDPSTLPPKWAAVLATVTTILHLISRTTLKAVAVSKGMGVGDPIVPFDVNAVEQAALTAASAAQDVAAAIPGSGVSLPTDAEEAANQPPPAAVPESAVTPDGAPGDVPIEQITPTPAQGPTGGVVAGG